MAQVFHPAGILVLKLCLIAALGLASAGGVTLYRALHSPPAPGDAPWQPIPFSHKHHVGDDGIDCRYCHASVETAAFAGIPASSRRCTSHTTARIRAASRTSTSFIS